VVATLIGVLHISGGSQPSPGTLSLKIDKFSWVDDAKQPGRYQLEGTVENLQPGQLIYALNQSIKDKPGPLYLDAGPCRVQKAGRWICDLGFAGPPDARGEAFQLWVVAMDVTMANQALRYPRNLRALKTEIRARWGTVPLVDMLKEAVLRTGWPRARDRYGGAW
jgi:hypothetical protein